MAAAGRGGGGKIATVLTMGCWAVMAAAGPSDGVSKMVTLKALLLLRLEAAAAVAGGGSTVTISRRKNLKTWRTSFARMILPTTHNSLCNYVLVCLLSIRYLLLVCAQAGTAYIFSLCVSWCCVHRARTSLENLEQEETLLHPALEGEGDEDLGVFHVVCALKPAFW